MLLRLFLIAIALIREILDLPVTLTVFLSSILIHRCVCLFPDDFFSTSGFIDSGLKSILFSKIHLLSFINYQFNKHLHNNNFITYNEVSGGLKMDYKGLYLMLPLYIWTSNMKNLRQLKEGIPVNSSELAKAKE